MGLRAIVLAFALLVACDEEADSPRSGDDSAVGDAAYDARFDAALQDAGDADSPLPELDAMPRGDAAELQVDASALQDGSWRPTVPAGDASCLTTRSAPDPTLLFLPGKVFQREAGARGIADFEDTLLGYTIGEVDYYYDRNVPVGWSLWRKSTGELIDDSEFTADSTRATGTFKYAAGERFLVQERVGGPVELVLRDARDGHEVWRVGGWSRTGEKRLPRAGISNDGDIVWAAASVGATTSTVFEAYHTNSKTAFISFTTALTVHHVWTSADEIDVIVGDESVTTLRRFDRAGVELAPVGPLAGRFLAGFADESHLITTFVGGETRVFSRAGQLRFWKAVLPTQGGGTGNTFWLVPPGDDSVTEIYTFNGDTTPIRTFRPALPVLAEGQQVTTTKPAEGVVLVTANDAEQSPLSFQTEIALFSRGQLIQLSPAGIHGPNFKRPLGCGYTLTAANSKRLFISGSAAATFVYEAPFEAPVAALPPALAILPARGQERFALRTSSTEVIVYGADFQSVRTLTVSADDDVSISSAGDRLGTSRRNPRTNGSFSTLHSEVVDVATGQVLFALDHLFDPFESRALAPRFSPSGRRFAVSARRGFSTYDNPYPLSRTFEGDTELGSIDGQVMAWADESSVIAYRGVLYHGSWIMTAQRGEIAEFACDLGRVMVPTLWISPDEYMGTSDDYLGTSAGVLARCNLRTNTRIVDEEHNGLSEPKWFADGPIGFFGTETAYLRAHNTGVRFR